MFWRPSKWKRRFSFYYQYNLFYENNDHYARYLFKWVFYEG